MPEYNDFEPVDATDMVNLSNGEFTYSFPLLTVPGPGIGFPLVLNYHSGILPKQEASWVGLGWNLQAGSITRQVNKIPDDYKGDVISEYTLSSSIHGWYSTIGIDGVTVGVSWDNTNSLGGMVGYSLSLSPQNSDVGAGLGLRVGFNGVFEGYSANLGIGYQTDKMSAALAIGVTNNEVSGGASVGKGPFSLGLNANSEALSASVSGSVMGLAGISLDSKYGGSANTFSLFNQGTTVKGDVRTNSNGWTIPILIPTQGGVHLLTLSHTRWRSWLEGVESNRYFGFLYSDKPKMDCAGSEGNWNCSDWDKGDEVTGKKKHEFVDFGDPLVAGKSKSAHAKLMGTSEDVYVVATQGASGVFRPFRKEDGDYANTLLSASQVEHWTGCNDVDWLPFCDRERTVDRTRELEKYRNLLNSGSRPGDIYWRYLDDPGGAEYTDIATRDADALVSYQSKKITPHFINDKIAGFEILKEDGVSYVYARSLSVLEENRMGKQVKSADSPNLDITSQDIPGYAYVWLLTGIKSPDYFPAGGATCLDTRSSTGSSTQLCTPGNGDGGGWVRFEYGAGDPGISGRHILNSYAAPYNSAATGLLPADRNISQYGPNPGGYAERDGISYNTARSSLKGVKQVAYLVGVETPTHRADFELSERQDAGNYPLLTHMSGIPEDSIISDTETERRLATSCPTDAHGAIVEKRRRIVVVVPGALQEGDTTDFMVSYKDFDGMLGFPLDEPPPGGIANCLWTQVMKRVTNVRIGAGNIATFDYWYPSHAGATPDETPHKLWVMTDLSREDPGAPHLLTTFVSTDIIETYTRGHVALPTDVGGEATATCRTENTQGLIPTVNYLFQRTIRVRVPEEVPVGTEVYFATQNQARFDPIIPTQSGEFCTEPIIVVDESPKVVLGPDRELTMTYSYIDNYYQTNSPPCLDGMCLEHLRARKHGRALIPKPYLIFRASNRPPKRLDRIILKNKAQGEAITGVVKFSYDYSLCPNTPNSNAENHGKLTLTKVEIGAGLQGPFLPPYRFTYQNPGASFQNPVVPKAGGPAREWVPWEVHQWDRWGFRCTNCDDVNHEPNGTDAVAWNLQSIHLPSGGSLKVDYEPNRYSYLLSPTGAQTIVTPKVGSPGKAELLLNRGVTEKAKVIPPFPPELPPRWKYVDIPLEAANGMIARHGLNFGGYRAYLRFMYRTGPDEVIIDGVSYECGGSNDEKLTCSGGRIETLEEDFPGTSLRDKITVVYSISAPQNLHFEVYTIVDAPAENLNVIGGGIRVKSLSVEEPITGRTNKALYSYDNGVVAMLPPSYASWDDSRFPQNVGYEYYVGGSNVMYGSTTVRLEGKNYGTKYNFLTPRELPVSIHGSEIPTPTPEGGSLFTVTVQDFSSLWGALWKKEDFRIGSGGVITNVNVETGKWIYNAQWDALRNRLFDQTELGLRLKTNEEILFDGLEMAGSSPYVFVDSAELLANGRFKYFGLQQKTASHRYFWKDCDPGSCPQGIVATTQMVVQRFIPQKRYATRLQEGVTVNSASYYPDFRTGELLKSRRMNSGGGVLVTENIPAYTRYGNMKKGNQLTQSWAQTSYWYPSGRSDYFQPEVAGNAVASAITKWRPFTATAPSQVSAYAFRTSEEMAWRNKRDGEMRPFHIPADNCPEALPPLVPACVEGDQTDWISSGRFLEYDIFGRPRKFATARGTINEQGYGYSGSQSVYFAENTGNGGILFESFEHPEFLEGMPTPVGGAAKTESYAKTGANAIAVANDGSGSEACLETPTLSANTSYLASVWFWDASEGTAGTRPTQPGMTFVSNSGCTAGAHPYGDPASSSPNPGEDPSRLATGSMTWKRLAFEFSCQAPPGPSRICLHASKGRMGVPATVVYDELRVRPKASFLSTYTYDFRGNMTTATDAREVSTHFEYDAFGKLTGIRNDDGKLLSSNAVQFGRRQ